MSTSEIFIGTYPLVPHSYIGWILGRDFFISHIQLCNKTLCLRCSKSEMPQIGKTLSIYIFRLNSIHIPNRCVCREPILNHGASHLPNFEGTGLVIPRRQSGGQNHRHLMSSLYMMLSPAFILFPCIVYVTVFLDSWMLFALISIRFLNYAFQSASSDKAQT